MINTTINQNYQKETNISIILRALQREPESTRVKLSEKTGLTQASITKIVNQLIEWGAVYEKKGVGNGTGVGRKAIPLCLNTEKYRIAAVRINRKYLVAAIYDMGGRQYDIEQCNISSVEGARASMDRLLEILTTLLKRAKEPVRGIGVAVPGPFNHNTGRISLMSGFPGWPEIDIKKDLERTFHLPTIVEHDANCGALAEMWYSDVGLDADMVFVAADRGIGAGLIFNSAIHRGQYGFAGEIGHASINIFGPICECGNRGCLELYGSTLALENAYRQEIFDPMKPEAFAEDVSANEIMEMVRNGDKIAARAYSKTVAYLCFGVVGIINTLNPDTVVFADKIIDGGNLFLQVADQTFAKHLMPEIYEQLHIRTSSIQGEPMLLGASVAAFEQMLQTPSIYFQNG